MAKSRKKTQGPKNKKKPSTSKKASKTAGKRARKRSTTAKSVRQLRTQRTASATSESEIKIADYTDVAEERESILSIVKGLEGQVDTAFKLKEVLEAELDATQRKLAKEMETRSQLEAQVETLESHAVLAEQLREDVSFAEQERNRFADELAQTQPQLEKAIDERDSLTEQLSSAEVKIKGLESEKVALEAQIMNLKDRIVDTNRLREELAEATETSQD